MPMLTWMAMHPFGISEGWMGWVVIGFLVACVIALAIIIIKYR